MCSNARLLFLHLHAYVSTRVLCMTYMTYGCVQARMRACNQVLCEYLFACAHVQACASVYTYTMVHVHAACVFYMLCVCVCVCRCACVHVCIPTCARRYLCTYTRACIDRSCQYNVACRLVSTYARIYTSCVHTGMHTCVGVTRLLMWRLSSVRSARPGVRVFNVGRV